MQNSGASASQSDLCPSAEINVGDTERTASVVAGGLVVLYGLSKLSLTTTIAAVAGAALLYRGLTGHCGTYQALDLSTACDRGDVAGRDRKRIPVKDVAGTSNNPAGRSQSQLAK
ncbi:MAG: DUF2892 domain-containing protein [Planctomycetota bacterium]|nr:DUF2892 domain-containing protein [Planctomycetota bacterium]